MQTPNAAASESGEKRKIRVEKLTANWPPPVAFLFGFSVRQAQSQYLSGSACANCWGMEKQCVWGHSLCAVLDLKCRQYFS